MSEELVMPRLSDTMEEGTIGRWLVHEGDAFAAGDVLAEIETDKATMEFQAYDAGTVLRILVGDGETVALGAPIAIVGAEGETADEAASASSMRNTPRAIAMLSDSIVRHSEVETAMAIAPASDAIV